MPHDLVFFPDYRRANPYQALLYDHAATGLTVAPGTIEQAVAALRLGAGRPIVFHLHWEDAVYRNEPDEASALAAAQRFLDGLESFVAGGGRVVWTVHNAQPHETRYPSVHRALVEVLPRLVDVAHVHGHTAAAFVSERHGFAQNQIAVIPHGNYLPHVHPLRGDPALCRESLGLPRGGRAVLLFGRLAAYKGGADLLRHFPGAGEALHLVVAGRQVDRLDDALSNLPATARARVHVRDGDVPEDELPQLFHAVDAVVLPYRAILTSGAAMLALSLERPVLAPAHPGLCEVLTDGHDALLYPPGNLGESLRRLMALDEAALTGMQAQAGSTARRYDWRSLGLLMDGIIHRLRALHRPYRALPTARPSPSIGTTERSLASGRAAEG